MTEENLAAPAWPLPERLWIVIAAFNEQRRIGAVLDDLLKTATNVVVVDDGSRDDTAGEVLKRPVWLVAACRQPGPGRRAANGNRLCPRTACGIHHYLRRRRSALHRGSARAHRAPYRGGRRFRPRFAIPGKGPGHSLEPQTRAADGRAVHEGLFRSGLDRRSQRTAGHDSPRGPARPHHDESHGACVGNHRPDRPLAD